MTDIISPLLEKLIDLGIKKAEALASVRGDLSKLESELKDIQPFLRDAHDKQFTSKEIKDWVSRLNAVVYDAEDVIDLYRVKTKTNEVYDTQTRLQKKVRKFFHFFCQCLNLPLLHKTANEIEKINERLGMIWREKDLYGLVPVMGESRSSQAVGEIHRGRQTISVITEPQVFGREKDEQLVVGWLKKELTNESGVNTRVIAIVGMGGSGKTTLAQKVYHNPSINGEHFEKQIWVCVSEKPPESELFKQILEAVGGKAYRVIGLNALCSEIEKRLKEKRFLLVLDDVWDHYWWNKLNAVLQVGAVGSKVLITTRKKNVAMKMDVAYLHELECLSDDESWSLFKAKVLRRDEEDEVLDIVEGIGKDIVEKCKGLPLALNVVASLLRNKERTVSAWQQVAHSPSWGWKGILDDGDDNVLSAIALSYMNLPFPLKQCLTYCCIFPKDFVMKKDILVRLWVTEGFVSEDEGLGDEALAEGYLEALVDCSLIQFDENNSQSIRHYKLHDIVHDFALYVRGQEHLDASCLRSGRGFEQARFLFSSYKDEYPLEALGRQTKLRTLLLTRTIRFSLNDILCFRQLRMLDLHLNCHGRGYATDFSGADPYVLPESLGKLALLKYLSVNGLPIATLPESIAELSELQRLNIGDTLIKMLPEGISQLSSLRHLHLGYRPELKHLPKEIGRLTFLQTLERFIVGSVEMDGSGSGIAQLRHLNSLRGSLHIQHIERVGSREEAKKAELERKVSLQELELSCDKTCIAEFDEEFARKVEGIYEELRHPTCLKSLTITNYAGMSLPAWLSTAGYESLEDVTLKDCGFLEQLPSLGCLPNLVRLFIIGCYKVKIIDDGFHRSGRQASFPKLERLRIGSMHSLEGWTFNAQGGTLMPRLKFLDIDYCPKLRALPDSLRFTSPNELRMSDLPLLESTSLPSLENMRELELSGMPKLNLLGERGFLCGLKAANALRSLKIEGCVNMDFESETLAEAMESMVLVETLLLKDCPDLVASIADVLKPHHLPNLLDLNILSRGCSRRSSINFTLSVESEEMGTKMGGFRNLGSRVRTLEISLDRKVASLPEWVQHFHQLEELTIRGWPSSLTDSPGWLCEFSELRRLELDSLPELRSLPDAMQSLTRLEELTIRWCHSLTHLPGWLCEFSELRRLELDNLPKLRSLPDAMQGLTRLKVLVISHCPQLKERCRGVDKHKISHIPKVRLGG